MARCAEKNHFNLSSQAHLQAIGKVCYAPGYSLFLSTSMDSLSFCRLKQQKLVLCTHLSVHCTCIICVCVGVCAYSQEGKALKWPYVSYDPPTVYQETLVLP